jgi:hypothetical protein
LVILSIIFKGLLWWRKVFPSCEARETRVEQKDSTSTEMMLSLLGLMERAASATRRRRREE